jgi:hypothetical protein
MFIFERSPIAVLAGLLTALVAVAVFWIVDGHFL